MILVEPCRVQDTLPRTFEHTPRVRIRAELATLNGAFRAPFNDLKTQEIFLWHHEFVERVHTCGEVIDPLVDEFAQKLLEIVVDQNGHSLEEPLIGSDGRVYGRKALCCYIDLQTEERKGRSPFDLSSGELFYAISHPIVEAAISWLKSRNRFVEEVNERFDLLEREGRLPEIPTNSLRATRLERVRVITLEQRRREEERREAEASYRERVIREADEGMGDLFAPFRRAHDSLRSREAEALDEAIDNDARNRDFIRAHEAEIRRMGEELRQRNEELNLRIDRLQDRVHDVQVQSDILRREIEAAEAVKNSAGGSFWIGVGLTLLAASLSFGPSGLFTSSEAGGASLGLSLPI